MSEFEGGNLSVAYDPARGVYRATHDFAGDLDIDAAVVLLLDDIAEREGRPLSTRLYDVIQPDGLRRVFMPVSRTPRRTGQLSGSLDGSAVTVQADGVIEIVSP